MKTLFATFLGVLLSVCVSAQNTDLRKMPKLDQKKYLYDLSIELIKAYGPEYYREGVVPVITVKKFISDDSREGIRKHIGREYYEVKFPCRKTERLELGCLALIEIWCDNGEPSGMILGCNVGRDFILKPYRRGVPVSPAEQIPYVEYPPLEDWTL